MSSLLYRINGFLSHVVTCVLNKNGARAGGVAITTSTTKPGFASAVPAINLLSPTNWRFHNVPC